MLLLVHSDPKLFDVFTENIASKMLSTLTLYCYQFNEILVFQFHKKCSNHMTMNAHNILQFCHSSGVTP